MTSDFYVFVSDVPFSSYDLNTTVNQAGVFNYRQTTFAGPASINVNRTGRYVRVQLAGTGSLALAEVQVWNAAAKLNWLVTDNLGTPRIVVDKTGNFSGVSRHDYLPFGEELTVGRTTTPGYNVGDSMRQRFTQKERDNETGLDYFGARYYAGLQGRFTGVDPYNPVLEKQAAGDSAKAHSQLVNYIGQAQNWNRYCYALNNPLKYVDPDGAKITFSNADTSQQLTADQEEALRTAVATLRQQSDVADAFFSLYDQPSGQGPDLDVQVMADALFDKLPEVNGDQKTLAETQPGVVDINHDNLKDVRSASAIIVLRESVVNLQSENQASSQHQETRLEGVMSHEITHGAKITMDYNGYLANRESTVKNNIPYRERANEKLANAGSTVIALERALRDHIRTEQPDLRWPLHK